jgi:hypothetical protein
MKRKYNSTEEKTFYKKASPLIVNESTPHISTFPRDMIKCIALYLGPYDYLDFGMCCKRLCEILLSVKSKMDYFHTFRTNPSECYSLSILFAPYIGENREIDARTQVKRHSNTLKLNGLQNIYQTDFGLFVKRTYTNDLSFTIRFYFILLPAASIYIESIDIFEPTILRLNQSINRQLGPEYTEGKFVLQISCAMSTTHKQPMDEENIACSITILYIDES